MSTPQQRVHDITRRLLDLLEHGESLSPEAIELRSDLAIATAEAGHLDDSYYQVEELYKDARREHGPDHPATQRALEALEEVREIGTAALAAAGGDPAGSDPGALPGTGPSRLADGSDAPAARDPEA